jgi:hypothetical protein
MNNQVNPTEIIEYEIKGELALGNDEMNKESQSKSPCKLGYIFYFVMLAVLFVLLVIVIIALVLAGISNCLFGFEYKFFKYVSNENNN